MIELPEQIQKFKEFLEENCKEELHNAIKKGKTFFVLDFSELIKFDPDMAELLLEEPEEGIKAVELALEQFDLPRKFRIRFRNLPKTQEIKIKDVRSEHLGKFLVIEGIVRQATDVRPQITTAKFECPACGNTITIIQVDSKFKEPTRCTCGRRGRFRLLDKELVDAQGLILEESAESLEGGEQPKRLKVFLKEDLVEPIMEKKTTPGSKVRVNGVVKEVPIFLRTGAQSIRYDLMMDVNFIEPIEEIYEEIIIDDKDKKIIEKLAKSKDIYKKLTNSIAPSIYGHDDIKEALVLQLMGGVRKEKSDGTITRGDMHVLLVGDPGAAKSSILMYISTAAPKSRYVAGRSVTGTGITASVVKDEFLRGWALEAGALVLANNGVLCLDEMDKMAVEDTSALHEAMAQQRISISKANIQATLKAKTTILAAANPKLGRFDPYQPIANQIELPPALINRFDLIFPVRDLPDKKMDNKIATHILKIQQKQDTIKPEIEIPLLKKYISYARQNISPKLTNESIDEIKTFYVTLRNTGSTGDDAIKPIPISARQLEALVRLSEASARARLSKKVMKTDAKRAIRILKHCLMQVGFDYETEKYDIDRIVTGLPATQRSKIVVVRDIIYKLSEQDKIIPINEIMKEAIDKGLTEAKVEEVIEKLKKEGEIFEPRAGSISRV